MLAGHLVVVGGRLISTEDLVRCRELYFSQRLIVLDLHNTHRTPCICESYLNEGPSVSSEIIA